LLPTNNRKLLWDEENRLLAVSDNGFVSNYWYDASGERTVKESGDNEGLTVNGLQSAGRTGTTNFTAYISPYLVVSNGGNYTKHIYMGGQRITSKVSNSGIFTASPLTASDLQSKYTAQTTKIKERFDSLRVMYKGTPQTGGLISSNPNVTANSYFYHSDHLGSSSLITDASGAIVQHLEYVPFGETFIDERRFQSSWTTPYLFSGKERDEETGLLYFGARYQDSKYGIWYSVDPLAEKYPNISSYVYCADNPVKYIDPDGNWIKLSEAIKYNSDASAVLTRKGLSNNLRIGLKDVFTTPEGLTFFAQFAKKGDRIAGHTFTEDGVLSNMTLEVNDYSFSEESGNIIPSSDAGSIKIDPKTGTVTFNINTYQLTNKEEIVETVAHETLDHGYKAEDGLNGRKVTSENQDHKALRDKNMNHKGYKLYNYMKKQVEKISNQYKKVFKESENHYKKEYNDIK